MDVSLNHFQNTTSSFIVADFSFAFAPKSKICRVLDCAFSAIICFVQCMIALSAFMGRRIGADPILFRSIMITSEGAASFFFSRMHTNESDSSVCYLLALALLCDEGEESQSLTHELNPMEFPYSNCVSKIIVCYGELQHLQHSKTHLNTDTC